MSSSPKRNSPTTPILPSQESASRRRPRWAIIENLNQTHWLGHFAVALTSFAILLPFLRVYPEAIHQFCHDHLNLWQVNLLVIAASSVTIDFAFRLFSPRLRQLRWPLINPPIWLAWLLAVLIVCVLDTSTIGETEWKAFKGYDASLYDWAKYFFLPFGFVTVWHLLQSKNEKPKLPLVESLSLAEANWSLVEQWLQTEGAPSHDGFGHSHFADKLVERLTKESRSIGLIGAFGSGKTTILDWMQTKADARFANGDDVDHAKVFWVRQSCWGFENSTLAIQQILRAAIAEVEEWFDTFYIRSLPEAYRQTFTAGGDWASALADLFVGRKDPYEQFELLSDLLQRTNSRLVLIIEDLDRNETDHFSTQDVLAFLYRVRQHPRLQFVLTADIRSASRIDFKKLTDHIEHVPFVGIQDVHRLLTRMHSEAMKLAHKTRVQDAMEELSEFSLLSTYMLDEFSQQPIARAVVELLKTPRSLRLVLRRTHYVWRDSLAGEVNWVELFLVNVLRVAAPEAFIFVFRYRNRFSLDRVRRNADAGREYLLQLWKKCSEGCDWSLEAAEVVIVHLFPEAGLVFHESKGVESRRQQSVTSDRYWIRVCNERIPSSEIPDCVVLEDIESWKNSKLVESRLVTQLTTVQEYAQTFECVYESLLGDGHQKLLELFEQVIIRSVATHGNETTWGSTGFDTLRLIVPRYFAPGPKNVDWLVLQIQQICGKSMGMVYALNRLWLRDNSQIDSTISTAIRARTSSALCSVLTDYTQLVSTIGKHDWVRSALSELIFVSTNEHRNESANQIEGTLLYGVDWRWLGPILLLGLMNKDAKCVTLTVSLCSRRIGSVHTNPVQVDLSLLQYFFGPEATRVAALLREHADSRSLIAQLDAYDQAALREIVASLQVPVEPTHTDGDVEESIALRNAESGATTRLEVEGE